MFIASVLASTACNEGQGTSDQDKIQQVRQLQAAGMIQESIEPLIELIESGNRDGEILFRYGRAVSLTGEPARSVWALDAARGDPDWFVQASVQMARDAYRANNLDFALEILKRLREERPEIYEDDLPAMLLEARVLVNTRRHYPEALERAEAILERFPEEEEAVRIKAASLLGLKETDAAYDWIRQAGLAGDSFEAERAEDEASAEPAVAAEDRPEQEESQKRAGRSLGLDDREAYWCTVRATFKREAGEGEEAVAIVDDCLERYPTEPGLLNEAIRIYNEQNRFPRIREVLEAAHALAPQSAEIRTALVDHLETLGEFEAAEGVLRGTLDSARSADPNDPIRTASLAVDLAGYLLEHERVDEALLAFEEAIELLGDRTSPVLLFRYADALVLAERYDEAIEIANSTPVEVHGPMIRGRVAYERGDYEKAIEELDKAALLWPANAPIRYYLARSTEALGQFDRAIEEYRQAMRADPKLSAARERLARLHLGEGRVRHAATILQFISPKSPSTPSTEMRFLMIETQARSGVDPDLNVTPTADMPLGVVVNEAMAALARGLSARGGPVAAEQVFGALAEHIAPDSKAAFDRQRVELLIEAGQQDAALDRARAAYERSPKEVDSQIALGRALAARHDDSGHDDSKEAEKLLRAAVAQRPDEPIVWTTLGDLARARGDAKRATEAYERALMIDPGDGAAVLGRVELLEAAGKNDEAIARLRRYVQRDGPYDGRGAYALALRLEGRGTPEERVALLRQAIRFGAGQAAHDLLASIDPRAASEMLRAGAATDLAEPAEAKPEERSVSERAATEPKLEPTSEPSS